MREEDDVALARARKRIGTTLRGKYRLDRVIGMGGMATVYAATHRNGREVAVKLLHPELALNTDLIARFVREGYVANAVKHRGAVDVLDDDVTEEGTPFLVMELLHGESLEALAERGRVPVDAIVGFAIQALDVLAAAHARGVVHRDIKPANLFLTQEGQLKVLDFGIARLRDIASSAVTHTGMMLGTPAFMSPEQASGQTSAVGPHTDLWAVGAMMFTLASGVPIHEGDNAHQVLIRAATTPARSLAAVLPGAPAALVTAVDRALAFEPAARWPSAAQMRDALQALPRAGAPSTPAQPELADTVRAEVPSAPDLVGTARMPHAPAPPVVRAVTAAELITAEPVAMAPPPPDRRANASSTRVVLAFVIPFTLVVVGGLAVVLANRDRVTPSVAEPSADAPAVTTSLPVTAEAVDAAPLESSATVAPVVSARRASGATTTSAMQPARVDPPPASATPARSAAVPPATSSSVGPPKSSSAACNPPFETDPQGHKRWKRECL